MDVVVLPIHVLFFMDPALVFQRSDDIGLFFCEVGNQAEVHRFVRIKAIDVVQISGKTFGLVDIGELIFQGKTVKFRFERFRGNIFFIVLVGIASVERDSEVVQMEEAAGGKEGLFRFAVSFPDIYFYCKRHV